MTKKILVPIDFDHTERTEAMLKKVSEFADKPDSRLVLLNVIPDIPPYVAVQLPDNVAMVAARDARDSLKLLASRHGIESSATVQVEKGDPAHKILQVATNEKADLIVIGSHQPGLVDYLIGSVAGKVVRHAKCSVLVVR